MNIIAINQYQQNNSFKAKKHSYYISKKMLEKRSKNVAKPDSNNIGMSVLSLAGTALGIDSLLKERGITYCEAKDNTINIGCGKESGFFQIDTTGTNFSKEQAQELVFQSLLGNSEALGGFANYYKLLKDVGRQDIIQKGLKIHTYKLNPSITADQRSEAAGLLINKTGIPIRYNDLFFVDDDAFYYDKDTKTVYGVNLDKKRKIYQKPAYITCKFQLDNSGKAIGYKVNDWNFYSRSYADSEYIEQQEPSEPLPPVADKRNNKVFAESFRFGNSYANSKMKLGAQNVLKHLSEKAGIDTTSDKLQYIKFINNRNDDIYERRIGYYNPITGRSIIYNEEGKYLYQLEYNKNDFGQIIACSKF